MNDNPTPSTSSIRRRAERGSVYIVSLLALVVLSILGISLVFISQTEMEVGANERGINRVFYGADSGVVLAAAQTLTSQLCEEQEFTLEHSQETTGGGTTLTRGFRVNTSKFAPIESGPCNYCDDRIDGLGFQRTTYVVTSDAEDLLWTGSDPTPPADAITQAQGLVTSMLQLQPFYSPDLACTVTDPADGGAIKL